MLWIAIVIVVCEVVVFVQLLLSYQKRGARLKIARAPILKRIEQHRQLMTELSEKVQLSTSASIAKLEERVDDYNIRTGHAANLVADLDNEAHERAEELGLHENEEDEEEETDDLLAEDPEETDADTDVRKVVKDKGFDPFDTVRSIRGDLEDIFGHVESLRHDEEIVTNMAKRLAASDNGQAKRN